MICATFSSSYNFLSFDGSTDIPTFKDSVRFHVEREFHTISSRSEDFIDQGSNWIFNDAVFLSLKIIKTNSLS